MTILDRYILKSFFFNLILWFFCIIGIYVVFDLFTNIDGLIQAGKKQGSVPTVIGSYYLFKAIPIGMMLSSVLGLVSAMITVAMMMRHNELVPIQAAGISTIRIIRPLILAVIFVASSACVLREVVLPHFIDELVKDVSDFSETTDSILNATDDLETGVRIMGDKTFRQESRIVNPNFVKTLKSLHPDLSASDIKYLSYVYINLSTNEISSILNITQESCKKKRTRLRTKLGLPSNVDLYDYLISL